MVHGASSGHPGGSLGCVDLLTLLFFEAMNIKDFDEVGDEDDEVENWLNLLVDTYCNKFKSNLYSPLIEELNSSVSEREDF